MNGSEKQFILRPNVSKIFWTAFLGLIIEALWVSFVFDHGSELCWEALVLALMPVPND